MGTSRCNIDILIYFQTVICEPANRSACVTKASSYCDARCTGARPSDRRVEGGGFLVRGKTRPKDLFLQEDFMEAPDVFANPVICVRLRPGLAPVCV